MKKIIVNSSDINSTNIYDNLSGIDFNLVYDDYNSYPL